MNKNGSVAFVQNLGPHNDSNNNIHSDSFVKPYFRTLGLGLKRIFARSLYSKAKKDVIIHYAGLDNVFSIKFIFF